MRRTLLRLMMIWMAVFLIVACTVQSRKESLPSGRSGLHYASLLSIEECHGYTRVAIRDPWDTLRILHTYILVRKGHPRPELLSEGTVIEVPIERALVFSAVHCALMQELGVLPSLRGVCDLPYIRIPEVQKACRQGKIADVGSSMSPDIERIISLHPDAILLSPFENSGGYGRLEKLGVPIIECADYMETSPLGRAEWMKFYGMLFGKKALSDSLFAQTEQAYLALCRKADSAYHKPYVMSELKSHSAWYVPGGESTVGQMFRQAGARYVFASNKQSGSVPLSFETVYAEGRHADIWLIKYNRPSDMTYADIRSEYPPYAGFDAFSSRHIYGCNTGRVPFYEETPFHPDYLLKDYLIIFHPHLFTNERLRYYSPLEE